MDIVNFTYNIDAVADLVLIKIEAGVNVCWLD